jgi:hypothetical protein
MAGADGAGGPPGQPGQNGQVVVLGGFGPPGRPGRDARIGNLRVIPLQRRVNVDPGAFLTKVTVSFKDGATISVPKYTFNADTCALEADGYDDVAVDLELDVKETKAVGSVQLPDYQLVGN